jgi:signal transduction histidine kinase
MDKKQPTSDKLADELARRTSEFGILQRVSSEINATLELDRIYDVVLYTMDELFGFHHAIVLLVDDSGETLTVVASRGYEDQPIGGKATVGAGVIGMVAKKCRMMRATNLGQQRAYASAVRKRMEEAGRAGEIGDAIPVPGLPDAESQIAIPMMVKDTLIGVFSVESTERMAFTEHDEELVTIVANQSASAINNARLYKAEEQRRRELAEAHERLKQLNETLELRVRERTKELEQANRELRETQAQLVQSGKMASLGMLVAGIAHEINTPVGAINATQDTLRRAVGKLKKALESELAGQSPEIRTIHVSLDAIETANQVIETGATHVALIVRRLRSFARLDEAELQRADIHQGLGEAIALVHHEVKDRIEIVRNFGDVPPIVCYPGRLNQVFLNLLNNSWQAIKGGGRIVITTKVAGDNVEIAIGDNGGGIPETDLKNIFDPGFTTKGVGVGTGLGLSICYQIIQDHKGRIDVESTVGEGTTFTITLPQDAQ